MKQVFEIENELGYVLTISEGMAYGIKVTAIRFWHRQMTFSEERYIMRC